jgi:hypothetical protein
MPITAKLSRRFYERFGDDVVNELVEWLNAVDQSYRQEFKDLFDANFGALRQELAAMERRVEDRLEAMEQRFEHRFELRLAQVRAELEASIARSESRLIAWSFVFWLAQLGTMVGLLKLAGVL